MVISGLGGLVSYGGPESVGYLRKQCSALGLTLNEIVPTTTFDLILLQLLKNIIIFFLIICSCFVIVLLHRY